MRQLTSHNLSSEKQITKHVLDLEFEAIPEQVVTTAKALILDTIAVGVAGVGLPLSESILRAGQIWSGENPIIPVSILGRSDKLTASSAAFVNGFQIHCQEYDCVHERAVVHPLATIIGALLATAEYENHSGKTISGKSFITAVIGAVNIAAGLGLAVSTPLKFFRPATAGLFGATLGVAKLRGFDEKTARNALGLALAHCSGTMQAHVEGKATLPIQIANAARAAVMACDLAALGLEGPDAALEGPYGYFPLYEDQWDMSPVLDGLGKIWHIENVAYKVYPTGRAAQGGLLCIDKLLSKGIAVKDIKSLTLKAPPIMKRLVGRPWKKDMTPSYARLCFAYLGAVALVHKRKIGLGDFTDESFRDPAIQALAACITVEENGDPDPAAFTPQTLRTILKNGTEISTDIAALPGSRQEPFTQQDRLTKARECLQFGLGNKAGAIAPDFISFFQGLEKQTDVTAFFSRMNEGN